MLSLIFGVKRRKLRVNDSRSVKADAELAAKRSGVLAGNGYKCQACSYASRTTGHLDVQHVDDDHQNFDPKNLSVACHTCHPYQHVGETVRRADIPGEGLGRVTLVAAIPEISASDLNLLQRAIGMALLDEDEAPIARKMIVQLSERAKWVKGEFGTYWPKDFGAALEKLTDEEYLHRQESISDLRLLFNEETLRKLGKEMMLDYPSMPVNTWPEVNQSVISNSQPVKSDKTV